MIVRTKGEGKGEAKARSERRSESDAAELHRTQPSGDKRQKAGRMGKGEGEKERRGKREKEEKGKKEKREEKGKASPKIIGRGYGLASAMV